MVMGTAQYIAPEQALGHDATAASDVYALGVVGYEAVSGKRPFTGDGALTVAMKHIKETPPPLPADLPPNVRELIEITLVKNPGMRYRSGGPFADAVAAVRAGRRPPRPNAAPTIGRAAPTAVGSAPPERRHDRARRRRLLPAPGPSPADTGRRRRDGRSRRVSGRCCGPRACSGALAIAIAILIVLNAQDKKDRRVTASDDHRHRHPDHPAGRSAAGHGAGLDRRGVRSAIVENKSGYTDRPRSRRPHRCGRRHRI